VIGHVAIVDFAGPAEGGKGGVSKKESPNRCKRGGERNMESEEGTLLKRHVAVSEKKSNSRRNCGQK